MIRKTYLPLFLACFFVYTTTPSYASHTISCEISSDCPTGQICYDNVCSLICTANPDCPRGDDSHCGPTCESGLCTTGTDCTASGLYCDTEVGTCVAPIFEDGFEGTSGDPCNVDSDCLSGVCNNEGYCDESTCADGILNAEETDVDCGGPVCEVCASGDRCNIDSDCLSGVCINESLCQ